MTQDWREYCRLKAREGDIDAYLAALFAPPDAREDLWVLGAFAAELTHILDVVHEPMVGEIRLQWWREALTRAQSGRGDPHPLVVAMSDLMARRALPVALFEHFIDAQAQLFYERPFATADALARFCDDSAGAQLVLSCHVLEPQIPATALAPVIAEAAPVLALVKLLNSLPADAARRRLFIPEALIAQESAGAGDLFRGKSSAALSSALDLLIGAGRGHLVRARAGFAQLRAPQLKPAFLPLALAETRFARLEAQGFDPFAQNLEQPVYRRLIGLFVAQLGGAL